MNSPFLGQILTSMIAGESMATVGRKPAAAPDVPLERMEASAWAAWAKAARDEAAAKAAQPAGTAGRKGRHARLVLGLHR